MVRSMRRTTAAAAALRYRYSSRPFSTTTQTSDDAPAVQHAKRVVSATVVALDGEGDALATTSETSRLLRVPFAVPGDALHVSIWEKDLARKDLKMAMFGQLDAIETPSPERVEAPCAKYFGLCGGCKHQNVAYQQQLVQKQHRIQELFQSTTMDEPIRQILGVESMDGVYEYRNKMEFTCTTGRWMLESDKNQQEEEELHAVDPPPSFTLGMFPVSSVGTRRARAQSKRRTSKKAQWNSRILSIDSCLLQDRLCDELLEKITGLCESLGIQAYDFHTHEGFLKNLILRRGVVEGHDKEIMVGFVTTSLDGVQQELLDQLVQKLLEDNDSSLVSIVQHLDEEALRHRIKRGDAEPLTAATGYPKDVVLFGQDYYQDTILEHTFQVSLDSFFQPNSSQSSVLYSVIRDELARRSQQKKPVVWDLFCGVGSIGICMGHVVDKLVGFELVDSAVQKARTNALLNGYTAEKMQFHRLDLSAQWSEIEHQLMELMDDPTSRPDVIIVDPPRAGLHKKLIGLLRRLAPDRICYVSCNPQTQVRDLELLLMEAPGGSGRTITGNGYKVDFLQPVDMLPHTPHIETVAWLTRQ